MYDTNGDLMFPPVLLQGEGFGEADKFWADFPEHPGRDFLDYEYIYDSKDFLKMEGGKWAVFRKNSRKFPNRIGEELTYSYGRISAKKIGNLLDSWMDRFALIHDGEILIDYIFDGESRKGLIEVESGKLYGLNVWDENFRYINFRYCICQGIPFLSEYLRLLFYQDMVSKGKLVNDGGSLDNPALKSFKEKMNPCSIREVKGKSR